MYFVITLLGVLAAIWLQWSGSVPNSSVGGPMVMFFVLLVMLLVAGLYEALSTKRGVFGWLVSIVVAVVGGCFGAFFGGEILMPLIRALVKFEGSLVSSGHPAIYFFIAGQTISAMLGTWIALQVVNRFR